MSCAGALKDPYFDETPRPQALQMMPTFLLHTFTKTPVALAVHQLVYASAVKIFQSVRDYSVFVGSEC